MNSAQISQPERVSRDSSPALDGWGVIRRSPVPAFRRPPAPLPISRRASILSQSRLAKPAMLFSKSTAEQSQSNCKKEFSLKRIRLQRRSAVGRQWRSKNSWPRTAPHLS